jgi:hypothetical protein
MGMSLLEKEKPAADDEDDDHSRPAEFSLPE